jgi:hypothetical protein
MSQTKGTIAMVVDIAGLDKAAVLQALYARARPCGRGWLQYAPGPLTREAALAALAHTQAFDYLHGRAMKVDLSEELLDATAYDRANGPGSCAQTIERLRQQEGRA